MSSRRPVLPGGRCLSCLRRRAKWRRPAHRWRRSAPLGRSAARARSRTGARSRLAGRSGSGTSSSAGFLGCSSPIPRLMRCLGRLPRPSLSVWRRVPIGASPWRTQARPHFDGRLASGMHPGCCVLLCSWAQAFFRRSRSSPRPSSRHRRQRRGTYARRPMEDVESGWRDELSCLKRNVVSQLLQRRSSAGDARRRRDGLPRMARGAVIGPAGPCALPWTGSASNWRDERDDREHDRRPRRAGR
jgi:hypothetical protein